MIEIKPVTAQSGMGVVYELWDGDTYLLTYRTEEAAMEANK